MTLPNVPKRVNVGEVILRAHEGGYFDAWWRKWMTPMYEGGIAGYEYRSGVIAEAKKLFDETDHAEVSAVVMNILVTKMLGHR